MKTKQGKIDLTPRTRYLMGWAAGVENERGDKFEIEERDSYRVYHTKCFPSKSSAENAIKSSGKTSKMFIRAYSYETSKPENAKGMPLLSTVEETFYYLN